MMNLKSAVSRFLCLIGVYTSVSAKSAVSEFGSFGITLKRYNVNHTHLNLKSLFCTGGGGSSIVKVPGDVPPARVYFFGLLV